MNQTNQEPEIALALDGMTGEQAVALAGKLRHSLAWVKVGLELFAREGPAVVRELGDAGFRVFLDLKFHDIPATVAGAVRAAGEAGADLANVHAAGGVAMMEAARDACPRDMRVVAVTVLTSEALPDDSLVVARAREARASGLSGVVCAVSEVARIKEACGRDFYCVTPGIRPAGTGRDDQARVATPAAAARAGADLVVVGRAVTRAADPSAALANIQEEMRDA